MTEAKQAQEDKLLSYLQLMEGDFGEVCRTTMCQNNSGLSEEKGKAACMFSLYLCCISHWSECSPKKLILQHFQLALSGPSRDDYRSQNIYQFMVPE